MSFKCRKGLGVTNAVLKSIPECWCTYMEGTRTESKFHLRNSKKIGRGGMKKPGWSIWYQDKYDGVLVDRMLCVSVANLYLMRHFTGSQ